MGPFNPTEILSPLIDQLEMVWLFSRAGGKTITDTIIV